MSPIQLVLILLLVLAIATYFQRLRSRFLDNMIILSLATCAIVMIAVPRWTTVLANALNVGRGVDLVMYLAWIGVIFVLLLFYSKLRVLESHLTKLVRGQAIEGTLRPGRNKTD